MNAEIIAATNDLPYEDWLELRRNGIGGSDAAAVCGVSRYKSPVELWMEKTDRIKPTEAGDSALHGSDRI